jgi:demethylmenaquinone methyltransferase/2-methoxy-6-polyprenyl-1,4-benzoquinol methylase
MQDKAAGGAEYRSYTTASFARWARFYDLFVALFGVRVVRRAAVEIGDLQPGDRVLDVCTGTGDVALEFAKRCDEVTGIDLTPEMLAQARKKDPEGNVRFLQMDATRLDFADGEFDVSAVSFGLHDMPAQVREAALREMVRVTKDRIVIVEYNPPGNRVLRALYVAIVSLWESKYFPEFARADLRDLLARCGLRLEAERAFYLGLLRVCRCRPRQ